MPTYEFRCPEGHEFEKFYRTISGAEAQALCPQCGLPAERVMSPTGFSFKGSGFYLTDYGKNAHRDRGTPETKAGAPADSAKSDAKSDAKGDATSEARSDAKSDAAKRGEGSSAGGAEAKPAAPKAAEPKPAATPPKKSSTE
jgi:putative FmdB family regulatory protein